MTDATARVVAKRSAIHGRGAFASVPITEGTHIGEYTGAPTADDGTYVLWVEGDDGEFHGIDGDGVLKWLNHSSAPNVEFDGPQLYALRDIDAGEELTFHYGEEWEHVD
ncbi:MAG: SET domain-containing protein-lysine N-methyltransferase [Actinomycetota bacterium]